MIQQILKVLKFNTFKIYVTQKKSFKIYSIIFCVRINEGVFEYLLKQKKKNNNKNVFQASFENEFFPGKHKGVVIYTKLKDKYKNIIIVTIRQWRSQRYLKIKLCHQYPVSPSLQYLNFKNIFHTMLDNVYINLYAQIQMISLTSF